MYRIWSITAGWRAPQDLLKISWCSVSPCLCGGCSLPTEIPPRRHGGREEQLFLDPAYAAFRSLATNARSGRKCSRCPGAPCLRGSVVDVRFPLKFHHGGTEAGRNNSFSIRLTRPSAVSPPTRVRGGSAQDVLVLRVSVALWWMFASH